MLWGAVASMFCITLFTAMIAVPHQTKATQWTAVASIIAYNFVFGYAWVGVPWLYGPEVRNTSGSEMSDTYDSRHVC